MKNLEWDSTYSQHQPRCKQAPVNLHVLLKLQMLFTLDPSASKQPQVFRDSCSTCTTHNKMHNLCVILKGYLQKASEMSFGVNGFQYKKSIVPDMLSLIHIFSY